MAAVKYRYFWSEARRILDLIDRIRTSRNDCFNASSRLAHEVGAKQAAIRNHHIAGFIFAGESPRRPHWIPKGKVEGHTIYSPSGRFAKGKAILKAMEKITLPTFEDAISHTPFKRLVITDKSEVLTTEISFIQSKDLNVARVMIAAPAPGVEGAPDLEGWTEWTQAEATEYQFKQRYNVC